MSWEISYGFYWIADICQFPSGKCTYLVQLQPKPQYGQKSLSSSLFCDLGFTGIMAKAIGDVHGKGDMEYLMSDMEVTFLLYYLAIYIPSILIGIYEDTIVKITMQSANLNPKCMASINI